jgi:uncharacterized protein YbaA (DUF1428 family)
MSYIDGFVVPVPKKRISEYRRIAMRAGRIWKEFGALEYMECIADDVKPGKVTSFPRSVKLKKNEVAFFSYIVYKNRAARDRIVAKIMKDPRIPAMMAGKKPPFDMQRMIYGGFKGLVEL